MANHTAQSITDTAESATELLFGGTLVGRLLWTTAVLVLAWVASRLSQRALERSARRIARAQRLDEQQTRAFVGRSRPMSMGLKVVFGVVALISLVGIWGLETAFAGLLAGAGFAGIVIGLAAGDTIGDVIAGFLIFYNHPFDIGDWVEVDGTEGIIHDVALGATTLITWDNEKVTIPNRLVEGSKVKNFSHARVLRRRMVVGVEYGSDLSKAMAIMEELANQHPEVLPAPLPDAVTHGFGQSSVDLVLRFYVEPVRSSAIKVYTDLVKQVHDRFRAEGINIAFPHMQLVPGGTFHVQGERTPGGA